MCWGLYEGSRASARRRRAEGTPGSQREKGTQSLDGPETWVGGDLRARCSVAPPSSAGSPLHRGSSPPRLGLLSPTPPAQLAAPLQRPAARVPRQPPTARLPGPRPAPAIGQGAPPADADPAGVIPVALGEPRAATAICASAVEDSGSSVGVGRVPGAKGRGTPGALDRGSPASRHAARVACFM